MKYREISIIFNFYMYLDADTTPNSYVPYVVHMFIANWNVSKVAISITDKT